MNECPVAIGDILAGKYRVEKVLGQGGMGVVVAAWHIELEQRVAVKFLLARFAQDRAAAERFRREARAAVKIKSEHVARVSDVGTLEDGAPYMVMEYLEGCDLETELARVGTFEIEEAVKVTLQACLAMAEAHAKGMVHRDLKPANLFRTTRADGAKIVKVLDFGISKSVHGSSDGQLALTGTAAMIGSPLYMSPEQLESSRDVDELADVWSLGVILYELLTGAVPFGGDTLPQLVAAVLKGQHTPAIAVRPDIPQRLSDTVSLCLQKDRSKRMPSVAQLAVELAAFMPEGDRYSREVLRVVQHSAVPQTGAVAFAPPISVGSRHPDSATDVTGPPVSAFERAPESATQRSSTGGSSSRGVSSASELEVDVELASGGTQQSAPNNRTINSWGRTGGQSQPIPAPPRRGHWAAAGVATVALGVAVWIFAGGDKSTAAPPVGALSADPSESTPTAAATTEPKLEAQSAETSEPADVANIDAGPSAEPTAGPTGEETGEPSADVTASEGVETAGHADPTPSTATPRPKPRPKRPAPKVRPKPSKDVEKSARDESSLPNFGGRR